MTEQDFFNRYNYNVQTNNIGGGSFGTVYKAYDNVLDREVAIKVSEVKHIGNKEFSLLEEYNAIKNLPVNMHIANYEGVYRFVERNGTYDYAIMQYYPLGNLSAYLKNNVVSLTNREKLVLGILEGIAFLHKHKVVHRDLKPSNILVVDRNGVLIPKITDFGLSKQASTDAKGSRFTNSFAGGTLQYSSPEQLKGLPLKLNTDLWSFGVIAYEILTDNTLFEAESNSTASAEWQNAITQKILHADITKEIQILPKNWQKVVSNCLERDVNKRAQNTTVLFGFLNGKEDFIKKTTSSNNNVTIIKEVNQQKKYIKKPTTTLELTKNFLSERIKSRIPYMIITIMVIFGIWFFKPWQNSIIIKPNILEEFLLLKKEADSAYYSNDMMLALQKYEIAFNLMSTQNNKKADELLIKNGINDSIISITKTIEAKENTTWSNALSNNNQKLFKEYISTYPNGKYMVLALSKIDSLKSDSLKKMNTKKVVISKSQIITNAKKTMIKLVESRKETRRDLQLLYKLQADLTLHKLAIAMYRHLDGSEEYKIENQIMAVANNINNQNQDFIDIKALYFKNPLSRFHFAAILPYLFDTINEQNNLNDSFKKQIISLDQNDLYILKVLGEAELILTSGRYDSRFVESHDSQRSILNLERIINESIKNSRGGSTSDVTTGMWNRLLDINTEIVNLLDSSKLSSRYRDLYNSYKIKNEKKAFIKGEYLSMLLEVGRRSEGFYRYRYLRYGEITLITKTTK